MKLHTSQSSQIQARRSGRKQPSYQIDISSANALKKNTTNGLPLRKLHHPIRRALQHHQPRTVPPAPPPRPQIRPGQHLSLPPPHQEERRARPLHDNHHQLQIIFLQIRERAATCCRAPKAPFFLRRPLWRRRRGLAGRRWC